MRRIDQVLSCLLAVCLLSAGLCVPAHAADALTLEEFSDETSRLIQTYDSGSFVRDMQIPYDELYINYGGSTTPVSALQDSSGLEESYMIRASRLAAAVGGTAEYDSGSRVLTIQANGGTVRLDVAEKSMTAMSDAASEPVSEPAMTDQGVLVPLTDTAEQLGVTSAETGSGVTVSYTYQTARLIAIADEKPSDANAVEIVGGYDSYWLIQYADPTDAVEGMETISRQSCVQCVSPDSICWTFDTGAEDYSYSSWGSKVVCADTFNDALIAKYGSVEAIPEVVVAVADTGFDTDHAFIKDRYKDGCNFLEKGTPPEDDGGHGTHIAGIITDMTLPSVKIMPLKVGSYSSIYSSCVIEAIPYAIEHNAVAINMSFGDLGRNAVMEAAIEKAYQQGVVCVAASGNAGTNADYYFPANIVQTLTVSNVQQIGGGVDLNYMSNTGRTLDLAAPGTYIVSSAVNGGMTTMSGTSMAAPAVTAAVAMVRLYLYDPVTSSWPSAQTVTRKICMDATNMPSFGWNKSFGYGVLRLKEGQAPSWQARIGATEFATIAEAVAAAASGDTIELAWNTELSSTLEISKAVTLKPANANIFLTRAAGFTGPLLHVVSGGALTLSGSSQGNGLILYLGDAAADGDSIAAVEAGGALTLASGVVMKNNRATGNGGAIRSSGTVILAGGSITATAAAGCGGGIYSAGQLVFQSSAGQDVSADFYLAAGHPASVSAGLAGMNVIAALTSESEEDGAVLVCFANGITPAADRFVLTNSALVLAVSGQNLIARVSSGNAARIGNAEYATLQAAINASQENDVIVLLRSSVLTTIVIVRHSVTISSPDGYQLIWKPDSIYLESGMLSIASGTLTLGTGPDEHLILDGGSDTTTSGVVAVSQNTSLVVNSGVTIRNCSVNRISNSAIRNSGTTFIHGGLFTANSALTGSVVYNSYIGSLTVDGGTFEQNVGPVIYVDSSGNATVSGGIFQNNTGDLCTVLLNKGTLNVSGGTFQNNVQPLYNSYGGGCILNSGGTLNISGGTFSGNVFNAYGAVWNNLGTTNLTGGTITGNKSRASCCGFSGGGVCLISGTLNVSGAPSVSANTANGLPNNIYLQTSQFLTLNGNLTAPLRISHYNGNLPGTKIAETSDKTFVNLKDLIPDSGDVVAQYLASDTEAPYDICWMTQIRSASIAGTLRCGCTLTAQINGADAPASAVKCVWSFGSDAAGWTDIPDTTGAALELNTRAYLGKMIRLTITGTDVSCTGSVICTSAETVGDYVPVPAPTPAAAFLADGPDGGLLSGVGAGMQYSLDGGVLWQTIPAAELRLSDVAAAFGIRIRQPGNGTTLSDSAVQLISVTRAQVPAVSVTQPSVLNGSGRLSMEAGQEYSTDQSSWISAAGETELVPGTYYIRWKASGTALASDPQAVVIHPVLTALSVSSDSSSVTLIRSDALPEDIITYIALYDSCGRLVSVKQAGKAYTVELPPDGYTIRAISIHASDDSPACYFTEFTSRVS